MEESLQHEVNKEKKNLEDTEPILRTEKSFKEVMMTSEIKGNVEKRTECYLKETNNKQELLDFKSIA